MLELLAFAVIAGQTEIGPGLIQTDYLNTQTQEVVTIVEDRD